tara:strand:- start:180 stop:1319 length:1140 start_codon:yes stop_codon:yes gene_type:complete
MEFISKVSKNRKNSIRFFGGLGDSSGYGNAVMNFCKSFSKSSVNTKFVFDHRSKERFPDFISSLNSYSGKTNIDFYLHAPPYNKHSSMNYKIGYFYWEADRLPSNWSSSIRRLDEIWAPCELVKRACLKSGFRGPINIVPTPSDFSPSNLSISIPSPMTDEFVLSDDVFRFYSIFQWHERKGYKELIKGYLTEFSNNDNVILILKVNSLNIPGYTKDRIKIDIIRIKRKLNLKRYPKIYLIDDIVPKDYVSGLHRYCHCYVAPHHGEGWGMPIHDAIDFGNHIIVTKFGGVTEFLDDNSANIIDHSMGPVKNMDWSRLYSSNQNWAHPDVDSVKRNMRNLYENHNNMLYKTKNAKMITSKMTIDSVARGIEDLVGRVTV